MRAIGTEKDCQPWECGDAAPLLLFLESNACLAGMRAGGIQYVRTSPDGKALPESINFPSPTNYFSGFYNLIPHRVTNEFAYRVNIQFPHYICAMRFRSVDAYAQIRRNFLAASALRQQLHDFTFSSR